MEIHIECGFLSANYYNNYSASRDVKRLVLVNHYNLYNRYNY